MSSLCHRNREREREPPLSLSLSPHKWNGMVHFSLSGMGGREREEDLGTSLSLSLINVRERGISCNRGWELPLRRWNCRSWQSSGTIVSQRSTFRRDRRRTPSVTAESSGVQWYSQPWRQERVTLTTQIMTLPEVARNLPQETEYVLLVADGCGHQLWLMPVFVDVVVRFGHLNVQVKFLDKVKLTSEWCWFRKRYRIRCTER